MTTRIKLRSVLLLGVVIAALAGCSESKGEAGVDLLSRLPQAGVPGAVVVDVARARKDLGVGDVDVPKAIGSADSAERRFANVIAEALPVLKTPFKSALLSALDFNQVTAIANNGSGLGRQGVVLVATGQSFDDLAAKLTADGYTRDGQVLTATGARAGTGRAVAGGDGLLAIGDTAATVQRAVESGAGNLSGTVKDLMTELGGPAVSAVAPGGGCPTAVAVADDLVDRKGRLVIVASGVAPDRLRADESELSVLKGLTYGEPAVDGDRMTVPFTYSDERLAQSPLSALFGEVPLDEIYSCA